MTDENVIPNATTDAGGQALAAGSSIVIRPHAAGDVEPVRDLIVPIQREEFGIAITYADQPDLGDVDGFYRRGAGEFWVAEERGPAEPDAEARGDIVGTIALIDIGDGRGALRKMFVRADRRGREYRVAGRLLDTLLAHAADCGFAEIWLGTTDRFLAAHRFYEKHGFDRVAEANLPASFPRMVQDTVFFRRAMRG